jgi:hypothetical protein
MHIMFENIIKHLFTLWDGSVKARRSRTVQSAWVVSERDWTALGNDIAGSHATVPAQMARKINASLDNRTSWTADTWSHILLFLGPIVLNSRLPQPYYRHFMQLSSIARRITLLVIDRSELANINRDIGQWVRKYES